MTAYFRSAVAASVNQRIEFKNAKYSHFTLNELMNGRVNESIFYDLFKSNKDKKVNESENVVIIAKTIKSKFESQEKKITNIEDLTGIYFIPAILKKDGILDFDKEKLPWIPREFLEPMIEKILSIGTLKDYNNFMEKSVGRINKIDSWKEYIDFARNLYEFVTKTKFDEDHIKEFELDPQVYILKDDTIDATRSIMQLYDELLDNYKESKLYENFIKLDYAPLEQLIQNNIEEMYNHCGQMGGEYPLSPSQRECVHHLNHMEDGEILAINGPPGTGKTTLLQSIVANLYVQKALKKEKPPLIVASSTNNQAVTNIIESFGKIKKIGYRNLEERWIEGVNSFAVYFPSSNNEKIASKKGYHYTNNKGENFFSVIDSEENREKSKEKLIKNCEIYFNEKFTTIDECEKKIHQTLCRMEELRKRLLHTINEMSGYDFNNKSANAYLRQLEEERKLLNKKIESYHLRIEAWRNHFNQMPFYYKLLPSLPCIKKRIQTKNRLFINENETFLNEEMLLHEIEEKYSLLSKNIKIKLNEIDCIYERINRLKDEFEQNILSLKKLESKIFEINKERKEGAKLDITSLKHTNDFVDITIRYLQFWLSVHYYECRWAKGEDLLTSRQKNTTYQDVLEKRYNRLSMVTPCYVMTFYQLPKNFLAYAGNKKFHYLYNFIDLLIVDEAGQVSPEIAACSFSLAKKAVIVGDIYQIEPVWSVNSSLDKTLAVLSGVIENEEQFTTLEQLGLNSSSSSVMKVASKSCKYRKFDERGLFLLEHRRCYNEIISYCNDLVYRRNLIPMRGKGESDNKNPLKNLSFYKPMGYKQIDTDFSHKKGNSRFNIKEACEIAKWINENYELIKVAYGKKEKEKNLIGIITPFKAQVDCIAKEMKKICPPNIYKNISVGTVHTFQGAERRIIIMSTVYGKLEGCYFIDANESMLNVAVSRAKDCFLVFGDIGCLKDDPNSASGLLKQRIQNMDI